MDNTYYYCTENAFRKKYKQIFKNDILFAVSNLTLKKIAQEEEIKSITFDTFKKYFIARSVWTHIKTQNMDAIMWHPKLLAPIEKKLNEYKEFYQISQSEKMELAAALQFDSMHPDQVVFVCDNTNLANAANLFFGNDSIIIVK